MPDVPHGVDAGVAFVEDDQKRRRGKAIRQCFTVQILPVKQNN